MASSGHFEECLGYVLHCRPLLESSLLVYLLTLEHGRICAVTHTVSRSSRKQNASNPQPFCILGLRLKMQSGLPRLSDYEQKLPRHCISGRSLYAGLYMNEMLMRCLPEREPHSGLLRTYSDALDKLGQASGMEPALRQFEQVLLEAMGHGITWTMDVSRAAIEADACYIFSADSGFIKSDASFAGQIAGRDILAIADNRFESATTRRAAKRIMRAAFIPYLGDKPLYARALFSSPKRA